MLLRAPGYTPVDDHLEQRAICLEGNLISNERSLERVGRHVRYCCYCERVESGHRLTGDGSTQPRWNLLKRLRCQSM
jgi:hypothetical protein